MTYLKTTLISAAAIALAAPAFAADGHMEKKHDAMVKVKTTATMTDQEVAMMKKMQMDAMRKKHMESMGMTTATSVEMDTTTTMHTDKMHMDKMHDEKMHSDKMHKDGMHPSKVNDTVGEILQADGEPSIQSDQEIIVEDYTITEAKFRSADDDGMIKDNAIVVPGSGGTTTTVTCPAGTTAQTDMTCMVTGDYMPDLNE